MRSLHFSVIKASEDVAASVSDEKKVDIKFSDEVLSQVTSFIWDTVTQDWSNDLIAFSSHASRLTANVDDALLLMRRNTNLEGLVKEMAGISADQTKSRGVKRPRAATSNKRAPKSADPSAPSSSTSTPRPTKKSSNASDNNPHIPLTPLSSKPSSRLKVDAGQQENDDKDSFEADDLWLDEDLVAKPTDQPSTSKMPGIKEEKSPILTETICLDDSFEENCFAQSAVSKELLKEEPKKAEISRPICTSSPKPSLGEMMNSLPTANDDSDFSDFD